MGDESVSRKLKARRHANQKHMNCSDTELLAISGDQRSKLLVLCGYGFKASRVFQSGEFSARIIQADGGSSVAMATCMVGEHRWMLAKDSMAVRVGGRSFVFALPGVLYGLAIPLGCSENVIQRLEEIFNNYGAYHDLAAKDGSDSWNPQSESEIWSRAYEKLENLAAKSSTKIAAAAATLFATPTLFGGRGDACDISLTKIQRAVRISAAVKLASRALISGALVPHEHLHVTYPPAPAPALPSMWALSDLLDSIESSGRVMPAAAPLGSAQGFWWLRIKGVELLLDVVRVYGVEARKKPRMDAGSTSEVAEEGDGKAVPVVLMGRRFWGGSGEGGKVEGVEKQLETCVLCWALL